MKYRYKALIVFFIAVLLSPFIVFDLEEPALLFDIYEIDGKVVACGPKPRTLFCRPSYHNSFYTGNEWPFRLYFWFCRWWCNSSNYIYHGDLNTKLGQTRGQINYPRGSIYQTD